MIDSIYLALSGMLGHERGLNVIGNNVSNMNTTGFRGSTVSFSDLFSGAPPNHLRDGRTTGEDAVGRGLATPRTQIDLHTVQAQQTGRDLDLSLSGEGYFVVQDGSGAIRYTRNGAFEFDKNDELVLSGQDFKVMSRDGSGNLVPISLKGLETSAARSTTEVTFNGVISSGNSAGDSDVTIRTLDVFDKTGNKHTVALKFSRDTSGPANGAVHWKMTVTENDIEVGSGTLEFIGSQVAIGSSPLHVTLSLQGTDPTDIAFNFDDVQAIAVGNSSTLAVQKQDGFGTGTIATETFDAEGTLKITYSNGQTATGPKLALAQVSDDRGLVEIGNALFAYQGTQSVAYREAADDLRVQAQSLEPSNVNLTSEFSQLILMQRGYQASSQVISTANDMMQQLLEMRGTR
jgi:flagellar hook protein FlgE